MPSSLPPVPARRALVVLKETELARGGLKAEALAHATDAPGALVAHAVLKEPALARGGMKAEALAHATDAPCGQRVAHAVPKEPALARGGLEAEALAHATDAPEALVAQAVLKKPALERGDLKTDAQEPARSLFDAKAAAYEASVYTVWSANRYHWHHYNTYAQMSP